MKDKWNIFHITFIFNVIVQFIIEFDKVRTYNVLTMSILLKYSLIIILGAIALVAWRRIDKYAFYLYQKNQDSQQKIIIVRNLAELAVVLTYYFLFLLILNSAGIYQVQFGVSEVFIVTIISGLLVGIISIVYCKIKMRGEE